MWAYYSDNVEDGVVPLQAGAATKPEPIVVVADDGLVALDEDTAYGLGDDLNLITADGSVELVELTLGDGAEFSPRLIALGG